MVPGYIVGLSAEYVVGAAIVLAAWSEYIQQLYKIPG